MRAHRLQNALAALGDAMREVNSAIEEMRREHDPLASHIFVARRFYRNMSDTKSGKRHHLSARLSWQQACELGFRGDLEEWERLLEAAPPASLNDSPGAQGQFRTSSDTRIAQSCANTTTCRNSHFHSKMRRYVDLYRNRATSRCGQNGFESR